MIDNATFDFLKKLKKNNNREWFEKNKEKYLIAKENVTSVIDVLIAGLAKKDKAYQGLTGKSCVYRIYRDIRFSNDKTPYKINIGAGVNPAGRKAENAGYYVHFEPGNCFIAGGMWMPNAENLKKIRQEIDYNGKDLHKILNNKTFKSYYPGLDTEHSLKTAPKGYPKDHPDIDILKLNSFIVYHSFNDKEVMSKEFGKHLLKAAEVMKPFLRFLNTALD